MADISKINSSEVDDVKTRFVSTDTILNAKTTTNESKAFTTFETSQIIESKNNKKAVSDNTKKLNKLSDKDKKALSKDEEIKDDSALDKAIAKVEKLYKASALKKSISNFKSNLFGDEEKDKNKLIAKKNKKNTINNSETFEGNLDKHKIKPGETKDILKNPDASIKSKAKNLTTDGKVKKMDKSALDKLTDSYNNVTSKIDNACDQLNKDLTSIYDDIDNIYSNLNAMLTSIIEFEAGDLFDDIMSCFQLIEDTMEHVENVEEMGHTLEAQASVDFADIYLEKVDDYKIKNKKFISQVFDPDVRATPKYKTTKTKKASRELYQEIKVNHAIEDDDLFVVKSQKIAKGNESIIDKTEVKDLNKMVLKEDLHYYSGDIDETSEEYNEMYNKIPLEKLEDVNTLPETEIVPLTENLDPIIPSVEIAA